jgi:RNA polymerase sigma-70 factor (ECF subfamily)
MTPCGDRNPDATGIPVPDGQSIIIGQNSEAPSESIPCGQPFSTGNQSDRLLDAIRSLLELPAAQEYDCSVSNACCAAAEDGLLVKRQVENAPAALEPSRNPEKVRTALEEEIAHLYAATSESLLRYATLLAANDGLAQEAVQEAFLQYYVARLRGDQQPFSRARLFRTARAYIREENKSCGGEISVGLHQAVAQPDRRPSPENSLVQTETIQKALRILSPREMECLRLRGDGFSYKEIGHILGIETGTVGALLARGAGKFQKAFVNPDDSCDTP